MPITAEAIEEAKQALAELPSVFQGVGTIAQKAKRCRKNSKLARARWDEYEKLLIRGSELIGKISMLLTLVEEGY